MQMDLIVAQLVKNGREVYRQSVNGSSGISLALEEALAKGTVATAPELMKARILQPGENRFWLHTEIVQTEEYEGIDTRGRFGKKEPVVVCTHGGGYLTPHRINHCEDNGTVPITVQEFDALLHGAIMPVYHLDDIVRTLPREHAFSVVTPYRRLERSPSRQLHKKEYLAEPSVRMRSIDPGAAESHFDMAKKRNLLGNYHHYREADWTRPHGRLLCIDSEDKGMMSMARLSGAGCFVYARKIY